MCIRDRNTEVELKQVSGGSNITINNEEIINKVSYSCKNELISNSDKIIENELFKNDIAVSYTHLDVYKRQYLPCVRDFGVIEK